MSNAFAICVNKRSRRKKFLLSVQSVREIENCSLSPSSTPLSPLTPSPFHCHTALVRLLAGNFHRVDSKLQYDIAAAGAAPWLMQAFCEIAFELSCR